MMHFFTQEEEGEEEEDSSRHSFPFSPLFFFTWIPPYFSFISLVFTIKIRLFYQKIHLFANE